MFYQTVDYLAECAIIEISRIQRKVLEMNYNDLPTHIQAQVQSTLKKYWGNEFHVDSLDDYYSNSGMRYGYVAVNQKQREVLVCDCTPDDGDTLISIVRF